VQRQTLSQPTRAISGTGLFSAQSATVVIEPRKAASGIVFTLNGKTIPAHIDALSSRPVHPVFAQLKPRCTSIGDDDGTIATIEHVLSALAGLGVTDAVVDVRSEAQHAEIPIMDGSAKPFADACLEAGLCELSETIEPITVRERIEVRDGDASIVIEASDTPSYAYSIDYPGTPICSHTAEWDGDRASYIDKVAPARTFSLEHEANQMQSAGLFTHLSPRDMLVIGESGPIENEYRVEHECAQHKLLDLIGDLALVGAPLLARVSAVRSGHALAHEAARAILRQAHA
jgi:UDP-3-O-acyl N-acetylglucosamine deacetylase